MVAGRTLRIELLAAGRVHCSTDGGSSWADLDTRDTGLGVWIADVPGSAELGPGQAIRFTVWWPAANRWEGRDFGVEVR
jgi:glucoamylase